MRRNHARSAVRACVRLPWQPSVLEWSVEDGFPYAEGNSADSETGGRRTWNLTFIDKDRRFYHYGALKCCQEHGHYRPKHELTDRRDVNP